MKPSHAMRPRYQRIKQRGVVLFFALIALLAMSLAAVALIRSIDTGTLIAGNLTFKQSATSSGDSGLQAAIKWLAATDAANTNINVLMDATHPFNITGGTGVYQNSGYYSSLDPLISLTNLSGGSRILWDNSDSTLVGTDTSGNTIRYVIQRMCRIANTPIQSAGCLFSKPSDSTNSMGIQLPQDICQGTGCPSAGQSPQIRITAKISGPRNTVSYVQAFVY